VDSIDVTLGPELVQLGGFGTRYLAGAEQTGAAYVLLEHTLAPGLLGAPPHRHTREDEVSYVLSGRLTVWRAGNVSSAEPGSVVIKPRSEWHTFWNAGPEPVRFLELISPPAFAAYFRDLAGLIASDGPDPERIARLAQQYGLELDIAAMGALVEAHGLRLG
jgi:mannose-6-phosphate isomerase-like protein (cupin superfamily)